MDIAPGESLYEDEVKVKSRLTLRPHQAPPSTEFSRQEYWSGVPFPSASDLPDPGWNPGVLRCRQRLYRLSHQGNICFRT